MGKENQRRAHSLKCITFKQFNWMQSNHSKNWTRRLKQSTTITVLRSLTHTHTHTHACGDHWIDLVLIYFYHHHQEFATIQNSWVDHKYKQHAYNNKTTSNYNEFCITITNSANHYSVDETEHRSPISPTIQSTNRSENFERDEHRLQISQSLTEEEKEMSTDNNQTKKEGEKIVCCRGGETDAVVSNSRKETKKTT